MADYSSLKDAREAWEEGCEVLAEFFVNTLDALVVLTKFNNSDGKTYTYNLMRYFHMGEGWAASMDVTNGGTETGLLGCVKALAKLMADGVVEFKVNNSPPPVDDGSRFVGTKNDIEVIPRGGE